MIRCIGFTNGTRICEFLISAKSRQCLMFRSRIHSFERLIGTIRRECLDHLLFWTAMDLELKLAEFKDFYNGYRTHSGIEARTPVDGSECTSVDLKSYRWQKHCRGLYETPIAA